MNILCIADEDTVRGFRLAGIAGHSVGTAAEAAAALAQAVAQAECGVVILTAELAAALQAQVDALRLERLRPLIVEIPGPAGPPRGRRSLHAVAQAAIGLNVEQELAP